MVIQRRIFAVFSVFVLLLSSDFLFILVEGGGQGGIFYIANVRLYILSFATVLSSDYFGLFLKKYVIL